MEGEPQRIGLDPAAAALPGSDGAAYPPHPAFMHPYMMPGMPPMHGLPGVPPLGAAGVPPGASGLPPPFPMPMPWPYYPPFNPGLLPAAGGAAEQGKKGRGGAAAGAAGTRQRRRGNRKGAKRGEPANEGDDGEDANNVKSAVLRRFKENPKEPPSMDEVLPDIVEFATDKDGSKCLQSLLEKASQDELRLALHALLPEIPNLAGHVVGNFVVQKLYEIDKHDATDRRRVLTHALQGKIFELSMESYGCRVIQKALQLVPRDTQVVIADELKNRVEECIKNMHGNHVIQKCVEQMPPESVTFIVAAVEAKAEETAMHMYGCRVIQRLLEHSTPAQLESILQRIRNSAQALAQDNFGNYVVQHVLEHGRLDDKQHLLTVIRTHFQEFAHNKQASNVVERAFEIATIGEHAPQLEGERALLMAAVLQDPKTLQDLIDDKFGNYIVQRMIEHSRNADRQLLFQRLEDMRLTLEAQGHNSHAHHIITALNKEKQQP